MSGEMLLARRLDIAWMIGSACIYGSAHHPVGEITGKIFTFWCGSESTIASSLSIIYDSSLLYSSPPQSRSLAAACSGVISRCGSASSSNLDDSSALRHAQSSNTITYPTRNFLTVALLSNGG